MFEILGPTKNPLALSIFLRFELRDLSYLSIVFNTVYMCMVTMHMQDRSNHRAVILYLKQGPRAQSYLRSFFADCRMLLHF